MKFGVQSYTTNYTIGPVELGKEIMARHLQSLFIPEHSHIPVNRETPWGGSLTQTKKSLKIPCGCQIGMLTLLIRLLLLPQQRLHPRASL